MMYLADWGRAVFSASVSLSFVCHKGSGGIWMPAWVCVSESVVVCCQLVGVSGHSIALFVSW